MMTFQAWYVEVYAILLSRGLEASTASARMNAMYDAIMWAFMWSWPPEFVANKLYPVIPT